MVLLTQVEKVIIGLGKGKIGFRKADKLGLRTYEEALALNKYAGIYQRQRKGGKKYWRRLHWYKKNNPQTEDQQAWRGVFAQAITEWQALDPATKLAWAVKGKREKLPGYHKHIKEYLKLHRL